MRRSRRGMLLVAVGTMVLLGAAQAAFAYGYGGESKVESFFQGSSEFLAKVVGSGIVTWGLISTGFKFATGDHEGTQKGVYAIIGGAIIFLAQPIVGLIRSWTGL